MRLKNVWTIFNKIKIDIIDILLQELFNVLKDDNHGSYHNFL